MFKYLYSSQSFFSNHLFPSAVAGFAWHWQEAVTIYGREVDLILWNNSSLLMTREMQLINQPVEHESATGKKPQKKHSSKYHELWCCQWQGAIVVSVCACSTYECICFDSSSLRAQWIRVTWFQGCRTELNCERQNQNFPSSVWFYLSVSDSFQHNGGNKHTSVICCHGNCCQHEHQLLCSQESLKG